MQRSLLAVALVALALVLPVAAAQDVGIRNPNAPTPTTLYFHINGFQDFPINTQKPDDSYAASENVGLATPSTSCVDSPPGAGLVGRSYHTFYGFSSPGYVEYNFEENGQPRFHPERGISYDVQVDQATPFMLYWYLETQVVSGNNQGADPNTAPVPIPNVVVRGTIRTGDGISVGDEAYNEGEVIASGQSAPATLAGASTQGANYTTVNGRHVYEFAVPMDLGTGLIPKETGYNLRMDVFMDNPACNDPSQGYLMPNNVRVHSSPDARPRMTLAIMEPIKIEYIHPQFVGDDLVIHTSMNSPWGNYDVDETPGGIELAVEGPSEARSLARAAFVQRHHEHNFHTKAVDVSYVWPYKDDAATNGLYTVTLDVFNDQRTAQAHGTAQFEIGRGTVIGCGGLEGTSEECAEQEFDVAGNKGKDSPGAGLLAMLGILGFAAVALRRKA